MKIIAKFRDRYPLVFLSILAIARYLLPFPVKASDGLESHPCAKFDVPPTVQNANCGYVTVPEFHDRATKTTFKLAFIRLKTTGNTPEAIPLIMEQGGPGASSFQRIRYFTPEGIFLPLQKQRDILLIEQRGAYYSQPHLQCDRDETIWGCKERWENEGINLDAFNMVQHAHDIALVSKTLGYDRINYYGSSYAAQLGIYLLRQHPQRLRTLILDSAVATNTDIGAYQLQSFSHALRKIFAACRRDILCDRNYPDLENQFLALLAQLNENPLSLTISVKEKEEANFVYLNGQMFALTLHGILSQAHKNAAQLPQLVQTLMAEDTTFFRELYHQHIRETIHLANAMRFATICAAPQPPNPYLALSPAFSQFNRVRVATLPHFCQLYPVTPLPDSVYQPVRSDIPTLILHGEYDPVTPLPYGQYIAGFLSNADVFEYPGLGHGVLEQGHCPIIMTLAFLDRPHQTPDRSCIAKMGQWGIWENVLLPNSELNNGENQNVRESRSRYNFR